MRLHRNWFWGTFFLVGAVLLVVSKLDLLPYRFGFWQLVIGIFLLAMAVYNLARRNIGGSVFSLAFLAIVFAKPLGIAALAPWTILGAALLLTIGLSLLFSPHHFFKYQASFTTNHGRSYRWPDPDRTDTLTTDESDVVVNVNMGSSIRYLQSHDFQRADVNVKMGSAKLYFDEVQLAADGATINVDVSLGGVELYLPKSWNVKVNVDPSLGDIEQKGKPAKTGPVVNVQGRVNLSGLVLIYS